MRKVVQAVVGLAIGVCAAAVQAQTGAAGYPDRPIKWIVPYSAGSFSDTLCRALAPEVAAVLGQPLVIENLTGAGGTTGTLKAKSAAPDGYTILYAGSSAFATNVTLMPQLPYHPLKDFQPITMIGGVNYVLAANAAFPPGTFAALDSYVKANLGKVNFASPGNGTSSHLTLELLTKASGWRVAHLPYKGSTPAVNDLIAGHVQLMLDPYASVGPHIRSGRLKALAVTGTHRMRELPDVPTFTELGLKGFEVSLGWFGVAAPAGTPRDIVTKLNAAFVTALQRSAPKLLDLGVIASPGTPESFTAFIAAEIPRNRSLILQSGMKIQ